MLEVVHHTTPTSKPSRCEFYNAAAPPIWRKSGMANKARYRPTFIRQWRQHRHYSLDQLAERVPMDKGNLSKIERGLLPYNQELLERLADALMTDPASLLMRDPSATDAIWSLWDKASPGTRKQIESVAAALIDTREAS